MKLTFAFDLDGVYLLIICNKNIAQLGWCLWLRLVLQMDKTCEPSSTKLSDLCQIWPNAAVEHHNKIHLLRCNLHGGFQTFAKYWQRCLRDMCCQRVHTCIEQVGESSANVLDLANILPQNIMTSSNITSLKTFHNTFELQVPSCQC